MLSNLHSTVLRRRKLGRYAYTAMKEDGDCEDRKEKVGGDRRDLSVERVKIAVHTPPSSGILPFHLSLMP